MGLALPSKRGVKRKFQSLIGRLSTEDVVTLHSTYKEFQSLIGRLSTYIDREKREDS